MLPTFTALVLLHGYAARTRTAIRDRFSGSDHEAGMTTLEAAGLTLGLLVLAGAFVGVITIAVNNRLAQIT